MKKIIIAGALSVAVLGAGGAYAYQTILNTPKVQYFKAEKKYLEAAKQDFDKDYGKEISFYEQLSQKPFATKTDVTANLDVKGFKNNCVIQPKTLPSNGKTSMGMMAPPRCEDIEGEIAAVQKIINSLSYSTEVKMDQAGKKAQVDASFKLDGKSLLSLQAYADGEQTAVKSDDFYAKYLALKNKDLGKFMRQYDKSYKGEEELKLFGDGSDKAKLSEAELEKLFKDYALFLYNSVDEKSVTASTVAYDTPNGKQNFKKLTLNLSEEQFKNEQTLLLEKIKNDDRALSLIESGAGASSMYAGLDSKTSFKDELKKKIDDGIKGIKSNKYPNGFSMSVVLDKNGNIIDRTASVAQSFDAEGKSGTGRTETASLHAKSQENGKETSGTWEFERKTAYDKPSDSKKKSAFSDSSSSLKIDYKTQREADGYSTAVKAQSQDIYGEEKPKDPIPVTFTLSKKSGANGAVERNYQVLYEDSKSPDLSKIAVGANLSYDLSKLGKFDGKTKLTIGLEGKNGKDPVSAALSVTAVQSADTTAPLAFAAVNEQNAVYPAQMTNQQLQKLQADLENSGNAYAKRNEETAKALLWPLFPSLRDRGF